MGKIKQVITNIFLIILVIMLINLMYLKFVKKEKLLSFLGMNFFIVESGSMQPSLEVGELIITTQKSDYKTGDIVTILDEDEYIYTHRIVEKNENFIITRGDNNDIDDEKIDVKNVIGRVIFHSKILGFFVIYLLKPILIIYAFIVLIKNLVEILMKKEDANEEKVDN